jgi:aconitate hydratase
MIPSTHLRDGRRAMDGRSLDSFGCRASLGAGTADAEAFLLPRLAERGVGDPASLPFSLKVLLEGLLRREDGVTVTADDVAALASWDPARPAAREIAWIPARILLQDFTGVPALADLAGLRDAAAELGLDPARIDPSLPAQLVVDHSVQADFHGTSSAYAENVAREYGRNRERYAFLRWGTSAFRSLRVVPPGAGICHQVNLERFCCVVFRKDYAGGSSLLYPDSVLGTDSHTPMVNGIGVLSWGVGGIEAEAAMLGQPSPLLLPEVVGVRLEGALEPAATATDLVLTVTELLRKTGVVGKFVEYFGPGLSSLSVEDRATLANMTPEYGATVGYFPVDGRTLEYLRLTGRTPAQVDLVERYCRAQGLFREEGGDDPRYSSVVRLDLASVVPCLAGPKRPQDRVPLHSLRASFREALPKWGRPAEPASVEAAGTDGEPFRLRDGAVAIAAITSCTNTSNPSVMIGAALLAKKAVERGLRPKPWVKASFAPGSKAVTAYLGRAGLVPYLEALGFHLVGYGCTTCIGNSGPLLPAVEEAVRREGTAVVAVLSGNRNFEGRIHPLTPGSWLCSPPLVVAYALAGTVDTDLSTEPVGHDPAGRPVFLADLWPSREEVERVRKEHVLPDVFASAYGGLFDGDDEWNSLPGGGTERYRWDPASTYVRRPSFLAAVSPAPSPLADIEGARALAFLGDSVTTDHISPAGEIPPDSPAGAWLLSQGVPREEFNAYGTRRGNHEVMLRGTFANVRLENRLAPGRKGWWTRHFPSGELLSYHEASARYAVQGVPLLVIAGKEYGSGSSRDWAAKGPKLLGVRAVLAESFERIHRSNLVGMGLLPLQFAPGESADTLGLSGEETFRVEGIAGGISPGASLSVTAVDAGGGTKRFHATLRADTPIEVQYLLDGGVLPFTLRRIASAGRRCKPPCPLRRGRSGSIADPSTPEGGKTR